jgi:OPA family sugar phosphate sensor protein UhpC-like MFS transporter
VVSASAGASQLARAFGRGAAGTPTARLRIFWATWIAYAAFYLCRKNFSVLMPLLQSEAGISKTQLADILFGYSLCYALGQFLMGALADRYSPRLLVTAGLAVAAFSNLGMSLHPTFGALLALGMANGLAQSSGWPGLLKTMAAWFEPAERGVVMGWWTTNYVLGGFLATVFAAWAISGGDWRAGFSWPALLLLALAAVFALLARDRPAASATTGATAAPRRTLSAYRALVRQPVAWATAVAACLIKITRYSFLFWLPLYLTEHLRYRPDQAGYLSSVYELSGVGGALLAGYVSDRYARSRRYPVISVMMAALAAACLVNGALSRMGWAGSLLGIALIGFSTYGPDTLAQGAASQDVGGEQGAASAAGLVNGIASLGQLASPYLVAHVATRWGWDALFSGFVGVAALGSAITACFWSHQAVESKEP